MKREPSWFFNDAPAGVVRRPVTLKTRWALSTRGLRHRIVTGQAAWLNGQVQYAGHYLCGDYGTNVTLLPDNTDDGRPCVRCHLRDRWPAAPVVYRFSDSTGVIYIGSTGDLGQRLYAHRNSSDWWTPDLHLDVQEFPSLPQARAAEVRAIALERPVQNYMHNPARGRRRTRQVSCS